jgi:cGMP-dependent protein kinase
MGQCASKHAVNASSPGTSTLGKPQQKEGKLDRKSKAVYGMIKDIPTISALPDATKREVSRKVKAVDFKAGQVIMRQGESGNAFYLIAEGICNVFQDGELISTLRSGDYMGEQALIKPNLLRTATVKALNHTKCFTMDNETFQAMTRSANLAFVDRARTERKALSDDHMSISDEDTDAGDDEAMNEDTLEWLSACVQNNVLFKEHQRDTVMNILSKMKLKQVNADTNIITQGDDANCNEFYIIETGKCEVVKDGTAVDTIEHGAAFGELALVFNNPRTATIRALQPCQLWVLTRSRFKRELRKVNQQFDEEKVNILRRIPLLATLLASDLVKFAETLTRQRFSRGHEFFRQGDDGDMFYLITEGTVQGIAAKDDGSQKSFELGQGEFFGELALRTNKPRSATVMASSECVCFVAAKNNFESLFGKFDNAMERQVEEYQKDVQSGKDYRTDFLMKRSLHDFESGPVVGRGKYGLVQFVRDPQSDKVYALKAVKKAWVHSKNPKQSQRRIDTLFNERNAMRKLNTSPFLVKLRGTFKDKESVYFLMEAAMGGDFFNVLKGKGYVDEKTARFYVAGMVEAIDYMHSLSIIHRDLKPENIVLNADGYGLLTDFGFAKELGDSQKTYTLCGTPGYIAPEIILGQGYGKGSDWFAIGCVMFDMLTGAPPFPTRADQFSMIHNMMNNNLQLPMYLSFWAKDLLRNLIQLKPMKRFGVVHGGTDKIRNHKWFAGFDWKGFRNETMQAPIKPTLTSPMDPSNFDRVDIEEMSNNLDSKLDSTPLPRNMRNWDLDF